METKKLLQRTSSGTFDISLLRAGSFVKRHKVYRYLEKEQQTGKENMNDIETIKLFNSDPLPSRINHKSAHEICSKKNACVKKFRQIETRIRVSEQYKMLTCIVQKSMSTIMTALFCFLYDEKRFESKSSGFFTEWSKYRLCQGMNEYNDLRKTRQLLNITRPDRAWSFVMLTRDPIERFISGYVDKCIRKPWGHLPCNGCHKNMTCFIEREYEKMLKASQITRPKASFEDKHFFPQNWRCNLKTDYKSYKFIKYSSSDVDGFLDKFIPMAIDQRVPNNSIMYISNQMNTNRTVHSTVASTTRQYLENRLRSSPYLMEYIVRMFYYDFLLFNYSFPTGF
ncbi:unnamed protein product [Auanema sp. JU1783]|nr:unnamed protein product [Auanema sp. JU1783]